MASMLYLGGGVIIEGVWRFTQHTFLVVILAYNIVDVSSLHCLFLNKVFIKVQEAFFSFALLFCGYQLFAGYILGPLHLCRGSSHSFCLSQSVLGRVGTFHLPMVQQSPSCCHAYTLGIGGHLGWRV